MGPTPDLLPGSRTTTCSHPTTRRLTHAHRMAGGRAGGCTVQGAQWRADGGRGPRCQDDARKVREVLRAGEVWAPGRLPVRSRGGQARCPHSIRAGRTQALPYIGGRQAGGCGPGVQSLGVPGHKVGRCQLSGGPLWALSQASPVSHLPGTGPGSSGAWDTQRRDLGPEAARAHSRAGPGPLPLQG